MIKHERSKILEGVIFALDTGELFICVKVRDGSSISLCCIESKFVNERLTFL